MEFGTGDGGNPDVGSGSTGTAKTTSTGTGTGTGTSTGSGTTTGPEAGTNTQLDASTGTGPEAGTNTQLDASTGTGPATMSTTSTSTSSGTGSATMSTTSTTTTTMTSTGTGTTTSPGWGTPVAGGPTGTGAAAAVTVDPTMTVGMIGPGYAGFSYEKTHITNGSLTSTNANLIALYKLIGSPPLRLGADDVDNCNYEATGSTTGPAAPSGEPFTHTITPGMVSQICEWLGATGGKIIYGVNYKSNEVTASAAEAAYAMSKCSSSILGFEIGNEINRYGAWSTLQTQWESIATAVVATPGAMLIGPAAGGGDAMSLATPFAASESAKFGSKLVMLTMHYYAGTAGTTTAVPATLQTPDRPGESPTSQAGLVGTDATMNAAITKYNIAMGYRLGEVNTFSGHGQAGVSDTLISALWVMDMMFVTAENGGTGVNLHGGETGMDGSKPFAYEPIMEKNGQVVDAQPEYYGMLMFYLAGTGPLVKTTLTNPPQYFTAYAIKATGGWTSVILDNKNATSGVTATVNLGSAVTSASAIYLQGTPAGSLTAAEGAVTLAGATVSPAGVWNRGAPYSQTVSGNTFTIYIPAASAALVRVQ
jgi:hypothetical protein